jgi:hypothetical protein
MKVRQRFEEGDELWVRETYTMATPLMGTHPTPCYFATEAEANRMLNGQWPWKWTPAIHMKREHSRLTLTVTDVRVQRLQEISPEDCIAEGIDMVPDDNYGNGPAYRDYGLPEGADTAEWYARPIDSYRSLWVKINGAASWDANPWVVAVTFRPERRNIDA